MRKSLLEPLSSALMKAKQFRPVSGMSKVNPEDLILHLTPTDVWRGDAGRGRWICSGSFELEGETRDFKDSSPWGTAEESDGWARYRHGFEWLSDLKALGGDESRRVGRSLIQDWIEHHPNFNNHAWCPERTALRVTNWLRSYSYFCDTAAPALQDNVKISLYKQINHLHRAAKRFDKRSDLLLLSKGLFFGAIAFDREDSLLITAETALKTALENQLFSDGCPVNRSPATLVAMMKDAVDLKLFMSKARYPIPAELIHGLDRMAQALRFFRAKDGAMPLFNGSQEQKTEVIDTILRLLDLKSRRILTSLPDSKFERMAQGKTSILMDVGMPSDKPHPNKNAHHVGLFSFESCIGKERVIVNCGTHPSSQDWQDALRCTPAHSTLTLDDRNALDIRNGGEVGLLPEQPSHKRLDRNGGILIEAEHNGYFSAHGLTHMRRLFLCENGEDLRGEDCLTSSATTRKSIPYSIRFHLHPKVNASLIKYGQDVLLKLRSGIGLRFRSEGHSAIELEDSIYFGNGSRPRKTRQIVLTGETTENLNIVKWAFQRES